MGDHHGTCAMARGQVTALSPVCPRCGAASVRVARPDDRTGASPRTVRTCISAVCSAGFTWPVPDGAPAAPASGGLSGALARVVARMAAESVSPLTHRLIPGALVVDVGAGSGLRARALAEAGFDVRALEPDPAEAARARVALRGTGAQVVPAPLEELASALDGRQADAVVMWHVLEHVADPDAALAGLADVMRPGGLLMLAVPNRASAEARVFGDAWHGWEPSRHRWHFDEQSLRLVLGASGFGVHDIRTRGGWGYPAGIAFSLAPGLDPQINPSRALAGRVLVTAMIPVALGARALGRGGQLITVAHRI